MNELYFIEHTNFDVSQIIYNILLRDSEYFGFMKNNKPNISGFLNSLIPNLAIYREELHRDFLKNNNNDENLSNIIEQNIYNVYLKTFDMTDDSMVKIQFRVNKENRKDFIKIQDEFLTKYDMTFSKYIKSLLAEYASRPLFQREIFYNFKLNKVLINAIKNEMYVYIYLNDNSKVKIAPIDIEINPNTESNYIFGFSENKEKIYIIRYSLISSISKLNQKVELTEKDYEEISELEEDYFNNYKDDKEGE